MPGNAEPGSRGVKMERENMIDKLMWLAHDYDEYFFKEWLRNHVVVDDYKDDGENVEYDYQVL